MTSLYAIFDLPENATDSQVDSAYIALRKKLDEVEREAQGLNPTLEKQAKKTLQAIENAHDTLLNPELKKQYLHQRNLIEQQEITDAHPRLGQLCVTSGIITMAQLKEAVDYQVKSGMALGEVLQDMQFITQAELDGLLIGQQMIDAPSGVNDPTALRLVALNLISEDMALIAQIEGKSTGRSFNDIMRRHGWVDLAILDAVLG